MTRRITLAIAAAIVALLLSAGLANAQEPPETATATRLEPGLNLVGWVGEPTPVSQLFQQIPRLEAIWAWDAELRDWIVAAPGAPEWLGGLGRVTAGMGLRMQLGGDQPYLWRRSTEPTRGLVKLLTGWNLVAWSGADGAAIGDVVKGIGWSLRTVRRWDAASQQWVTWTSPERSAQVIANTGADQETDDDAEVPRIRRGEALWIEVARAVNWLQPTDILPRLVFPGGASQELQARVREHLPATLSFFRDQYGIQADPDFTIYVAKDVNSLIQAYDEEGELHDEASTRALWSDAWVGGWGGSNITAKQSSWNPYLLTHEYFHVLQRQLSRRVDVQWLVEGTAEWAEGEHQVLDGRRTLGDLSRSRLSAIADDTPTLRSTERENARWEYDLGWLATEHLVADAGADSWVEFWRRIASIDSVSGPDWRSAFLDIFGASVEDFYADFGAWQHAVARENMHIKGSLRAADGQPLVDALITACRQVDGECITPSQPSRTNDDGAFTIAAPAEGSYSLAFNFNGCSVYFRSGGFTTNVQERSLVHVQEDDVQLGSLAIPVGMCAYQIWGSITKSDGQPLADTRVSACLEVDGDCVSWLGRNTDDDGAFAITVPAEGRYRLWFNLEGCTIYFRSDGFTTNVQERSLVHVQEDDVQLGSLAIPVGMCAYQIWGSITKSDGQPLADTRVSACLEVDGDCVSWLGRNTDDDGAFAITVPAEGSYRVWFNLEGCTIYFRNGGFTTNWQERSTTPVDDRDVRLGPREFPADMCAYRISGRLVDSSGASLSDKQIEITAQWSDGGSLAWTGGWTDADGRFEIRVPSDGAYTFVILLRQQPYYCWRSMAEPALGGSNNPVLVSGADVADVVLQLPGTIEELCE